MGRSRSSRPAWDKELIHSIESYSGVRAEPEAAAAFWEFLVA